MNNRRRPPRRPTAERLRSDRSGEAAQVPEPGWAFRASRAVGKNPLPLVAMATQIRYGQRLQFRDVECGAPCGRPGDVAIVYNEHAPRAQNKPQSFECGFLYIKVKKNHYSMTILDRPY